MTEAEGVIADFQALDWIADATGIRLDLALDLAGAPLRESLQLERFPSAANSSMGWSRRSLAHLLDPILRLILRFRT